MHYTGQVYRHPMEGYTPLLEVTVGCSHNKCSFCTMYRETKFQMSPEDHIVEDLKEMQADYGDNMKRVYLLNADPFCLSTDKLIRIAELIHEYHPNMETITCYASVKNFKNKSLEDLKKLRALGYNQLHVGVETAYDPALKQMNKGYTREEAYEQIRKIKEAGIDYDLFLMMGVAGKGNGEINVKESIKFANETQPYMVSVMPTSVLPGSELADYQDKGDYTVPSELEMIQEERALIEGLKLKEAYFFGSHNYNLIPFSGELNKLRDQMLAHIDAKLEEIDEDLLNGTKFRNPV